jgi:predicted RNase H-related nuclease YkuK (DUF458 family)
MQVGRSTAGRNTGEEMLFCSPSKGILNKQEVFEDIVRVVSDTPEDFEIVVGADSHVRNKWTSFVIAISLIRHRNGGTFFYHRFQQQHVTSLQQRIDMEALYAVSVASELREYLNERLLSVPIRLHFDVGQNGPTRKFVQKLEHLARSNDFEACVKPDAFGASVVADKFTK